MCRPARLAEQDFSKLASQLASSLYWDRFLAGGFESLPPRLQDQFPGLSIWPGVSELKDNFGRFVELPPGGVVFFAGLSRTFITWAAECLFERCRSVLATDLEWPPYLAVLKRTAARHEKTLRIVRLGKRVLSHQMDKTAVVREVSQAYLQAGCDGLFLSDITHTGIWIPTREILATIGLVVRPRFTVIDGAQTLAQRPVSLAELPADLYVAGAQKWLGGYHPLRIAFVTADTVKASALLTRLSRERLIADPLHEFCEAVEKRSPVRFSETVDVTALLTAAAALAGFASKREQLVKAWRLRNSNRRRVIRAARPVAESLIDESLSSGTALLRPRLHDQEPRAVDLRTALAQAGVVCSEPLRGRIRLAMPRKRLPENSRIRLLRALATVGHTAHSHESQLSRNRSRTVTS
jgi:hypothetical protein